MRRALVLALLCLPLAVGPLSGALGFAESETQRRVVDRIVAHVEDDIVALSEVRELAAYQQLVEGRSEPDARLVNALVEQWIIHNEAQVAQFPMPAEADVDRELQGVQKRFASPRDYARRLLALGLAPPALRRIVTQQIYLTRYLDYRFRPAVQVEDEAIAKYYQERLAPPLAAKQQTVPPLDTVTEQIREVLVQQAINERVAAWLEETKSRLRIEIEPAAKAAVDGKP